MHRACVSLLALTVLGSFLSLRSQAQQPPAAQPAPSPASPAQDGCKAAFAIAPFDEGVMKLLATPIVPPFRTVFTEASSRKLQNWDLPSKVTPWRDRPAPEELARQWEELNKSWSSGAQGKDKGAKQAPPPRYKPYGLRPFSAEQWKDLEKWFAKNGPKQLSGTCADSARAAYILAIGVISGGVSATPGDANRAIDYARSAGTPQPESFGANAATVASHSTPYDELSQHGASGDPSEYTCVYLFRANGASSGQGATHRETPDYYYCHAAGAESRSAVTTMLKFFSKTQLP